MERIEEFVIDNKNFMYVDLSNFITPENAAVKLEEIKKAIAKYPDKSLYTITNIGNMKFDSKTKNLATDYMKHNDPYVKYGAAIGLDGIKKFLISSIMKLSGRNNIHFAFTKEQAINWLLKQE